MPVAQLPNNRIVTLVLKGNKSKILYFAGAHYGIIPIPKKKEANKLFLFPSRT